MAASKPEAPSPFNPFDRASRIADDTVFFAIFPDSSPATTTDPSLQTLHLRILQTLAPFTAAYIWQHEPFALSLSAAGKPHLAGKLRYGDSLDDEWFVVFLLLRTSEAFPELSIRVWDSDGEFLLIEAAYHLPPWLNPENSENRVFLRRGEVHIVPKAFSPSPSLEESLRFLAAADEKSRASEAVQAAVRSKVAEYPQKARANVHTVRVRVPATVARVLRDEPCLISFAVEGFYDRDVDSMRFAAKMERFLPGGEEMVTVPARMSRAMYAQMVQQAFQAPKQYPMPRRNGVSAAEYAEAEMGMKIACGFEMAYQQRRKAGSEGNGGSREAFWESLERNGYFQGLIPGSQEHRRLTALAEEYYRNSASFSRTSEVMSIPVRRIDEILASPYSEDYFKGQEVPPSDDDSWLYDGEDELNSALSERQKELELYNAKRKNKHDSKARQDAGESSSVDFDDFDPSEIAKSMKAFVSKVSSYEGAEVPDDRSLKEVDLDVERFLDSMESIMKSQSREDMACDDDNLEEGSLSDFDFDEDSDDESDGEETSEGVKEDKEIFMRSYSDALNAELRTTTLGKSFARATEQAPELASKKHEGTSYAGADTEDHFSPVDADVNLVKSLLDSFASQEGLPGPASNLLGLMGLQLKDAKKGI